MKWLPISLLAVASLYSLPQKDPCKPIVCCAEPAPGPFAFAFQYEKALNCPRNYYFHIDGLAMQFKQDGMQWAIYDSNGLGAPITNGTVEGFSNDHSDWDYSWGVRVGAGFDVGYDAWNLDFNWTHLKISDYGRANVTTDGGIMIPLFALGNDTPTEHLSNSTTSAVWDGHYNTVDLRLCKPYWISRYLAFSPHFGLRAAWIDQHFSVDYSGLNNGSNNRWIHHSDNDFWGIGSRCGFDSDWSLGKGFSLFGNFAASLLCGKFDLEQHLMLTAGGRISDGAGFDLDDDHYMNVPNFEIVGGLEWGKYFNKNQYRVALRAAYEFHYWWRQLNIRKFYGGGDAFPNDVVTRGDLSVSGFSLSLQFDM